jgi:hypothetical protein
MDGSLSKIGGHPNAGHRDWRGLALTAGERNVEMGFLWKLDAFVIR